MIRKIYWNLRVLLTNIFGTKIEKTIWANKTIKELDAQNASLSHAHRKLLIKKIAQYQPFSKVLEMGCGTGDNLYLLARIFPQVNFKGIDINSSFIEQGKKRLSGISNVELIK